jgi:K+-transporting ATPase c subunit
MHSAARGAIRLLATLLGSSVRAALLVMVVSGIAYPLLTTGVAQALFPMRPMAA